MRAVTPSARTGLDMAPDPCQTPGMTDTTDAQLRRVRGLLAKAESTTNPHEAEAFSAKAFELMERYRIELADVRGTGEADIQRTTYDLGNRAKYLRPSLFLLGMVAKHYGVVVLVPSTGNSRLPKLVGDVDDIAATVIMFESLMIQRDRAILASAAPIGVNINRFRSSAAYGFASRMDQRLADLRDIRKASAATGMELDLLDRGSKVMDALGNPVPRNTNRPQVNGHGMKAGRAAADRADIGLDRIDHPTGPRALN